jgi:hypothetical protein
LNDANLNESFCFIVERQVIQWNEALSQVTNKGSNFDYKGNNLFYISMYDDHMYQRGYVRSVPGAPMCGCVEKMPIVTRADCTEIAAKEGSLNGP